MLLNAYAFWQLGQIALYAAIAAFTGAALMPILTVLGLLRLRRVPIEQDDFAAHTRKEPVTALA
jgi:hypothetical protein